MWSVIRGGTGALNFLVGVSNRRGCLNFLTCRVNSPPQFSPLEGHPDLPIRKTMRRVLCLLTVMILKIVSQIIFFQSNKFTACKIKDGKEVANSLVVFNIPKIIHLFQGKKHLRT